NIFNPGKIVDAYPMDESLRYEIDRREPEIKTLLDFSDSEGILKAAEKCNGSGDCRKTEHMSGAMCPSYHATRNEKDTTRGRANALREFLTVSDEKNRFDQKELKEVFDLCLSCKACGSECPSNVDVATLKAEFLYQYQEANGYPLRSKLFAYNTKLNRLGSKVAGLTNAVYNSDMLSGLLKKSAGVAPQRSLPKVYSFNFDTYLQVFQKQQTVSKNKVVLYIDEFTRYLDIELGKDAIELLTRLGYEVELFYAESGRTYLSKGFLKQAKKLALAHIPKLKAFADQGHPVIGLEPSAILTFRRLDVLTFTTMDGVTEMTNWAVDLIDVLVSAVHQPLRQIRRRHLIALAQHQATVRQGLGRRYGLKQRHYRRDDELDFLTGGGGVAQE
ncbi:hypothetical protein LCGC14_2895360, partial [marine sediment metagenome]